MITLATLKDATEQGVFDQVVNHLRKQGVQSRNHLGCAYRGGNGLMCAAGCLIADDEYTDRMDSSQLDTGWQVLVNEDVVPSHHVELIEDLQDVHDFNTAHNFETWEEGFMYVANKYSLEYKQQENNQ